MARMERHRFDSQTTIRAALEGEHQCALGYLDGLCTPGEHGRQVLCARWPLAGNWLVRSLNLLSPLIYDREEARRWVDANWAPNEAAMSSPAQRAERDRLCEQAETDPLFPLAFLSRYGSIDRMPAIGRRVEAEEEGARTALALIVFKAEHGRYPARLEDLVPTYLPVLRPDPFSGQPLRYRIERDGRFTLYSVGEDGRDDGGDENENLYGPPRDWILTPQLQPNEEWVLVPVGAGGQATSQPASQPQLVDPRMMRARPGRQP